MQRAAVTSDCDALRAATTPPVQAAINSLMADNNLDAIIALTNGPAWPNNDNPNEGDLNGHFELFVGSSAAAAVSGYPDITVPAGDDDGTAARDHLHRRPLGRAEADRVRVRLRAGDAQPCPAAVHPDDRRRALPRRPEPLGPGRRGLTAPSTKPGRPAGLRHPSLPQLDTNVTQWYALWTGCTAAAPEGVRCEERCSERDRSRRSRGTGDVASGG